MTACVKARGRNRNCSRSSIRSMRLRCSIHAVSLPKITPKRLLLHATLLLIFRDQLDASVSLFTENNLPFTVIIAVLAAAGLIGGMLLYRTAPVLPDVPGILKTLRRHALFYATVLVAGTALLLA